MEIVRVQLSLLRPDQDNARTHNGRNIEAVKRSLITNNQYAPLVVNKNDMVVVVGNCRYIAMQILAWEECDCILLDLTPEQARHLSVVDNRSAELSTWDRESLKSLIGDLESFGTDADDLGFTDAELNSLFGVSGGERPNPKPSEQGERFVCPKCGNKWQELDTEVGN